jgi:uncharacterized Zn finger protein (UPF0148 family)
MTAAKGIVGKCPDCLAWLVRCPTCDEYFCPTCGITELEIEVREEENEKQDESEI